MKKSMMYMAAAFMAVSLAACTPTTEKQAETAQTVEMETGGASDKVPDATAPVLETVVIYRVEDGKLKQIMDGVETLDAESLAAKMVELEVLPEGTEVVSYEADGGQATLNLSQAPEDLSDTDKELFFEAVAQTFVQNMELTEFKLLIDGESFTGSDEFVTYLPEDTSGGPGAEMK